MQLVTWYEHWTKMCTWMPFLSSWYKTCPTNNVIFYCSLSVIDMIDTIFLITTPLGNIYIGMLLTFSSQIFASLLLYCLPMGYHLLNIPQTNPSGCSHLHRNPLLFRSDKSPLYTWKHNRWTNWWKCKKKSRARIFCLCHEHCDLYMYHINRETHISHITDINEPHFFYNGDSHAIISKCNFLAFIFICNIDSFKEGNYTQLYCEIGKFIPDGLNRWCY